MKMKALSVAIAGALAAPMAAQAVDVKLSGQINRAIMFADDGVESDILHVDNDNSSTRWRLTGSEDIGGGMKAGVTFEVQMESNSSGTVTIKQDGDTGAGNFSERWSEVWFSGNWGKVSLGQGDGAGNGMIERDLSGTTVAALASRQTLGRNISFRTGAGADIMTVGQAYNHYDSFSRYDRIRYDTPTLGPGIVLSASSGNDELWEVGGSIRTSFGGGKLDAALFYADGQGRGTRGSGTDAEIWGGSASFLFSQGTSITAHYADRDPSVGEDTDTWGVKLGHKWGMHAVAIDYSESENGSTRIAGAEADTIGLTWVYTMPKPKVELYATYRNWDLDVGGAEDIDIMMVGSRIKF